MTQIHPDLESILVTPEQIDSITTRLAEQITRDYFPEGTGMGERKILAVGVLTGSVFFFSDLLRKLPFPLQIDFIKVSSYHSGTQSSGSLTFRLDLNRTDYADVDLLVVEDIVDSGRTLKQLTELLRQRGARSVRTVSLLDKPERREVDYTPDYVGQTIPDAFVVGYGLDYNENYRELPYIGILKPDIYN